ncbi:MAG: hypothetical protein ACOX17_02450 [Christensenellales bacterium]|jgi:hypothetical protein
MNEVIEQGSGIVEQVSENGLFSLSFNDIIWAVGIIVLLVLAIKVAGKIWKGLLIAAAVIIITVWVLTKFVL